MSGAGYRSATLVFAEDDWTRGYELRGGYERHAGYGTTGLSRRVSREKIRAL